MKTSAERGLGPDYRSKLKTGVCLEFLRAAGVECAHLRDEIKIMAATQLRPYRPLRGLRL